MIRKDWKDLQNRPNWNSNWFLITIRKLMATTVKLISAEGSEIEVDLETAQMSVLIKSMIEDSGPEEDIPLPNVKKAILEKVIEFCQHLKEQPL